MGAFTGSDPKDTYLAMLTVGDANADVIPVTEPVVPVQDAAGNLSLLGLSQDAVEFIGILNATVASGVVMETGIDFTSDQIITSQVTNKDDTDVAIFFVTGTPEGAVTASPGSLAIRNDGGAGTSFYVKETGTSNTGWVAYASVATDFIDLDDTPIAYVGDRWLKVNGLGNAVEFVTAPASTLLELDDGPAGYDDGKFLQSTAAGFILADVPAVAFLDLSDTMEPNYTGDKHAFVKVNDAETGLAFDCADPDQGDIVYFNGSNWTKLPPDTSGKVLITQGPGANPKWDVASAGGSNDPDAVHVDVAAEISALTAKGSPAAGDVVIIEDVADSYNKKKVLLSNLLGNDATAVHTNISAEISGLTEKASPVDDDLFIIEDSEASNAKKKVKMSSIGGGGGGTDIPHFEKGTGLFNAILHGSLTLYLTGTYNTNIAKITAWDCIRSLRGGVASPSYTYYIRTEPGSYGAGNSDPLAEYISVNGDNVGTIPVFVKVSDGTTTTTEQALNVTIGGDAGGA